MRDLPHLAQRLFNVPLAITPQKAEVIMAALADRLGIARLFRGDARGDMTLVALDSFDLGAEQPARERPYEVVAGVAVIPVADTLVNKLGSLRPYSGMTGYDGIRANLSMALHDDLVNAIVLDIDSPGGEVAGCFDLVDDIHAVRGEKPLAAILSENAFSAGYAIASAVDPGRIYVPRTGGTGSVGVICMHVDFEDALRKDGIEVNILTDSEFKADGTPYKHLKPDARDRWMADIREVTDLFCDTVARNRGLSASKVRATKAATFLGAHGVETGFADAVMAPNEAFRAFLAEVG